MKKVTLAIASVFAATSFAAVAAPVQMTETEMAKIVAGSNPLIDGNDINPTRSGLIIDDVLDQRYKSDKSGGRDNDIDVTNPGRASRSNEGPGADINR